MFRKPKSNFRSQRQIIDSDEEDQTESSKYEADVAELSLLEKCAESDDENGHLAQTRNLITKFKDSKLDKKKQRSRKLAIENDCASFKTSKAEFNLSFEGKLEEVREAIGASSGAEASSLVVSNDGSTCQIDNDNEIHDRLQKLLIVDCASTETAIKTAHKKHGTAGSGGNMAEEEYNTLYPPLKETVDDFNNLRRSGKSDTGGLDNNVLKTNLIEKLSPSKLKKFQSKEGNVFQPTNLSIAKTRTQYNEEETYWELQQIRKAITTKQFEKVVGASTHRHMKESTDHFHADPQSMRYYNQQSIPTNVCGPKFITEGDLDETINTSMKTLMITPQKPKTIVYSAKQIKERMIDRLHELRDISGRNKTRLDQIAVDLSYNRKEIEQLTKDLARIPDRQKYYQDLRWYVMNLIECYNEKLPEIKSIEQKLHQFRGDMTKKRIERKRQNVRKKSKELLIHLKPHNLKSAIEKCGEESQQEIVSEYNAKQNLGIHKRKCNKVFLDDIQHADGLSSDDDMSISEQSEIETEVRDIMSDVREEFSSLECVCERLMEWNEIDKIAFTDTFGSIYLFKMFSPLIRLQMLLWNPLTEGRHIRTMEWYKTIERLSDKLRIDNSSLHTYQSDCDEEESISGDTVRNLLSQVIEKVLVVRMTKIIRVAYDSTSTTQSLILVRLIKSLIETQSIIDRDSLHLKGLFKAINEKFRNAIENDLFIPIGYPKALLKNQSSDHAVFFQRQFWGAFKLYFNVLAWHGILSDAFIVETSLSSVLNKYLVISLGVMASCGEHEEVCSKCSQIIQVLPAPWITTQTNLEIKAGSINSMVYKNELQRFSNFLVRTFASEHIRIKTKCIDNVTRFVRKFGSEYDIRTMENKLHESNK